MNSLADLNIKYLRGVGENRAGLLEEELGIKSFRDLLYNFPFRHIDRSRFYKISELTADMPAVQICGNFVSFRIDGEGRKQRLVGVFTDGERMMEVVWFSKIKTLSGAYRVGERYVLFGRPQLFRSVFSMSHPEIEKYNPAKPPEGLRGVYNLTDKLRKRGITSRVIRQIVLNSFDNARVKSLSDNLPEALVKRLNLMPLRDAIFNLHNPVSVRELQRARERMKFEELFFLEMHILRFTRERNEKVRGRVFPRIARAFNSFYSDVLPFELTGAQKRVLREIRADMVTGRQMNRLVQGDVGSGKTMVAFMSMLIAVDNQCQACLMAPTEILAHQHYETISKWCDSIGLNARLLTGSTGTRERREIHAGLLDGSVNVLIGTHALIEETVQFQRLGLAVIDEQHRFGVAQRARMWRKNEICPHILIMTATPIPRTLAMTVYGDLDVSVIDELPPGRKPICTLLRFSENRNSVYKGIREELAKGRQAYFVFPLIHENEKLSLRSLEEGYQSVCRAFPDYRVCYVHGRMKPAEKEHQMQLFVSGEAQILVATTVIEVGVNVPNASVMLIENAERFGLSQLHQLRGRVGRGADQSYCILMTHNKIAGTTRKRLGIMTETCDGFLVSEADLKLRGPGDMEGTQQSGLAFTLKVANLASDGQIVALARTEAGRLLDANPELSEVADSAKGDGLRLTPDEIMCLRKELYLRFNSQVDWSRIS